MYDYVFHNSSNVTHLYISFLKGTTQYFKSDDVLTILKSLTMTTLSVADGSYTNLVNFFHHFFVVRTGFEPVGATFICLSQSVYHSAT